MKDFLERGMTACRKHRGYRGKCLNLIASEKCEGPALTEFGGRFPDLSGRYAEGENYLDGSVKERHYQGLQFEKEIEDAVAQGYRELFGADFVEPRPISGSQANLAAFRGLSNYIGDLMMSIPIKSGGHSTHDYTGLAGRSLRLEVLDFPYDEEEFNIDVEKSKEKIREAEPSFVTLGASLFPFSHPVEEVSSVAREVDAFTVFDAAHVLGLIAGGKFQDPLREGADFVTSSTHKTFPGTQRGVILGNLDTQRKREAAKEIQHATFPLTVSNHHPLTLAQSLIPLYELMEYGEDYAEQTIRNAKKLGQSLWENGVEVIGEHKDFTRSHQVVLDVREDGGGKKVAEDLEDAYIITNKNLLPWDEQAEVRDPSGIRLGSQELTKQGFKENEMEYIGEVMAEIIKEQRTPEEVKPEVVELAQQKGLEYGFRSLDELSEH